MTPYLSFQVVEQSQVGEARRAAARLAAELRFDPVASGRAALVVTELGTNLVRHARAGRLLIGTLRQGSGSSQRAALEILSLDGGPGMDDVERCLQDGYSRSGTPGTGLGAVKRLADVFSVYSRPGQGTVMVARLFAVSPGEPGRLGGDGRSDRSAFSVAGLCLAAPGETECGDAWAVQSQDSKARVIVADGIGHGPAAAEASTAAVEVFDAPGSPVEVIERAHERLRPTRGAAAAVVELDAQAGTLTFAGVGNVAGRVVSGVEDRSLMCQSGTLGAQTRRLNELVYPWPEHAFLILHSDGVSTRWSFAGAPELLRCDPAIIAGWLLKEHVRGRDDATVVVVRRRRA